jgi:hypothetical protein
MTSTVTHTTEDVLHTIGACPLCGSNKRRPHSRALPNLYSEKLANLTGMDETELIDCLPNVACSNCGLIYKRRWFAREVLEELFRNAVPWHPKGWDAVSDRFTADNFFSELGRYEDALRNDDVEQAARWRRALLSIIDSSPELQGHPDRPAIDRAIESGDCATITQHQHLIRNSINEPAPFKRFTGFRSQEMWNWCVERIGPLHAYAEVGCPLWGMLPIAGHEAKQAVFLSKPEPNYWADKCRMNGRTCTAALQNDSGIQSMPWSAAAPGEFDLVGLFQYLDHLEDPLGFMDELFSRARACAVILDHFSQPTAIQHFTGWTPEAIEWLARHFNKRVDDGFEPIRDSGNRLYLLY